MLQFQAVYCFFSPLNICGCVNYSVPTVEDKTTEREGEVSNKFLLSRELKHLVTAESVSTTT